MPRAKRVLFLSNSSKLGGANQYLLTLIRNASRASLDPIVVCPSAGEMPSECEKIDVPCEVFPYEQPAWNKPITLIRGLRNWRRLFSKHRPDVVHANDFMNSRSAALAAFTCRVPVICHVHFPIDSETLQWMYRGLPKPSAFLYNSRDTEEQVDADVQTACPRAQRIVFHNCVELKELETRTPLDEAIPPKVSIIANLVRVKGHFDFLDMAAILEERGYGAEYWIIGGETAEKGYGSQLQKYGDELGLSHAVRFLGHRDDVSDLLEQTAVAVCSSHVEPFGICNLEAMERGVPVVATRVGGIPEVVVDGGTGYLVPHKRPDLLAEKVGALLSNRDLRTRLGLAGRARVEEVFDAAGHAKNVVQLYETLAGEATDG